MFLNAITFCLTVILETYRMDPCIVIHPRTCNVYALSFLMFYHPVVNRKPIFDPLLRNLVCIVNDGRVVYILLNHSGIIHTKNFRAMEYEYSGFSGLSSYNPDDEANQSESNVSSQVSFIFSVN